MNIVHVYDGHEAVYMGEGSVPDVVWNLAQKSADAGHNVTVIERKWENLDKVSRHEGVSFVRLDLWTGPNAPWERIPYKMVNSIPGVTKLVGDRLNFAINAINELRKIEYDVVHFHLPFASNFMILIAPWIRKKTIYTSHIGETKKRLVEPTFSPDVFLSKRIAKTVALNPEMRSAYTESGVHSKNICVIPNGIDTTRFQNISEPDINNTEDKYGLSDGLTVLFVGSVTPRKGVIDLIKAVDTITSYENGELAGRLNFVITGKTNLEPSYVDKVKEEVQKRGIDQHIQITGYVSFSELIALYKIADIFVLPSYEEGSSIAISEAISSGTPIIASDIDGNRQQIEDYNHGLLTKPGDVDELAEKICELGINETLRSKMEMNLEERANEYSWSNIIKRYHKVYHEIS